MSEGQSMPLSSAVAQPQSVETPWLTVEQAARYAQCSTFTIYQAVQSGRLTGSKIGRARKKSHWRIHRDNIDKWLKAGEIR